MIKYKGRQKKDKLKKNKKYINFVLKYLIKNTKEEKIKWDIYNDRFGKKIISEYNYCGDKITIKGKYLEDYSIVSVEFHIGCKKIMKKDGLIPVSMAQWRLRKLQNAIICHHNVGDEMLIPKELESVYENCLTEELADI